MTTRRAIRLTLAVFASSAASAGVAAALAACASLSGLSGGEPDASCGASCSDATIVLPRNDASGDSSRADARREAAAPPKDAGVDHAQSVPDAGHDVHDAGAACTPVTTPSAGILEAGCAAPPASFADAGDAATCQPYIVAASAIPWVPPVPVQNVCSAQEIAALFSPGSVSPTCGACLETAVGQSAYGAIIYYPQITFAAYGSANVGGCIATLEPCNLACAQAVEAAGRCSTESCLPGCPVTTQETYNALLTCSQQAAVSCPCAAFNAAANLCISEITQRGSPAAKCIGHATAGESSQEAYEAEVEGIAEALCATGDGGV